ncbi:hypothetical protein NOC27_138 [Nitrosococcus oceani AFC27]|uniref:hypothetical protein n=1 Tax=Nitrosococcus oceani TaxID=1229 RepID=UPI000183C38D|nr:hypothetical protein [Nitrosococcus oceani]EDZ66811.1 hypothetical protein NOC27_138 [Nitrosococcus oceani AFC27]
MEETLRRRTIPAALAATHAQHKVLLGKRLAVMGWGILAAAVWKLIIASVI